MSSGWLTYFIGYTTQVAERRSGLSTPIIRCEPLEQTVDITSLPQCSRLDSLAAGLSPDGALLASSNSVSGFDIYDIGAGEAIRSFKHEIGNEERALPVTFIQGGTAIVGGSTAGYLNIWFVDSGLQLDPLRIPSTWSTSHAQPMPHY